MFHRQQYEYNKMVIWFGLTLALAAQVAATVNPLPVDTIVNVRAKSASRIVSGWEAQPEEHPWQLSLRLVSAIGGVTGCGGSIVHEEWAITAAHCTANRVTTVVRAGLNNLTRPDLIFETSTWYIHPLYNEANSQVQQNDISILHFERTLQFTDRIAPIRVQRSADKNFNYANLQLFASGYGLRWSGETSPEDLHWVYLSGISNFDCLMYYGLMAIIVDSTICTLGFNDTTQSTCHGDSGGPLAIIEEDGKPTLVGVASFVYTLGCHVPVPSGFIRPGHYHDWFAEVTGINFDWDWAEQIDVHDPENETFHFTKENSHEQDAGFMADIFKNK